MKLEIGDTEYYIKDDVKLPSNFDSMNDYEKKHYIHINNLLHREDGPAFDNSYGTKYWFLNGKFHRLNL